MRTRFSNNAVPYDASNGIASNGDLWHVWRFNNKPDPSYDKFVAGKSWGS